MNYFEIKFFSKYLSEGQEMYGIIHKHLTEVIGILTFWLSIALIPSFLFFQSQMFQDYIPFMFLELFLFGVYAKLIYDIFDWYNDVWIITNDGIIDLKWSLFKKNLNTVGFENIEGLEVSQNGLNDSLLKRGTIIIHKIGDDNFMIENTYKPFDKVVLIEEIQAELEDEESEASITEQRFDKLINTLGYMMEGYLDNHLTKKDNSKEDRIKLINEIKEKDGTIDLS